MSDQSMANLRGAVDLSSLGAKPAAEQQSAPSGEASRYSFVGTDANFSDYVALSNQVPLVIDLWAEWCGPCKQLTPILHKVIEAMAGKVGLVTVDVDSNPQLAQAFGAQSIPTVAALVGGTPVNLFVGAQPEAQVRQVIEQLLSFAQENQITGSLTPEGSNEGTEAGNQAEAEAEPELPPHHAEALAAIEAGDYEAAKAQYKLAMAQDPNDSMAEAGLAQVNLLSRLQGVDSAAARSAAAQDAGDVASQLVVADLDVAGGHIEDAFVRLLDTFSKAAGPERESIRERLVELFEVVGVADPRVTKARGQLASLLY